MVGGGNKNQQDLIRFIIEVKKMLKKPDPSHPAYRTRPPHQVFPEDLDCVLEPMQGLGAIYIGNLEAAQNPETLKKHQIGSILTACKNIHIKHSKQCVPFTLYIPGEDHQDYDLSLHFDTAIDFIHQSRKETNILVHCMAGISRSVTLVLAYLMKHMGLSVKQAYSMISRKRGKINPNPGFVRQLKKYEAQLEAPSRKQRSDSQNYTPAPLYSRPYPTYQPDKSYGRQMDRTSESLGRRPVTNYLPTQPNPEYESSPYPSNYNLKQSLKFQPSRPFQERANQTNQSQEGFSAKTNYMTLAVCDSSIETLSKDLEKRINMIKQKYYQKSSQENLYQDRFDRSAGRVSLETSKAVERRLEASRGSYDYRDGGRVSYDRSRVNYGEREPMRGSLYNGVQKYRPLSFNYSYMDNYM